MSIFPTEAAGQFATGVAQAIRENLGAALGVLAFIIGISMIMAWLDQRAEMRMLDSYGKRWRR